MKPSSQAETAERQKRSHFLALLGQLLFVAPDLAHVDHQSRVDQDLRHSNLTTDWQLPGLTTEGMGHAAQRALDRCPPVVVWPPVLGQRAGAARQLAPGKDSLCWPKTHIRSKTRRSG